MKRILTLLLSCSLISVLSFGGHCTFPEVKAKLKTEVPVATVEVCQLTMPAPAIRFANLVVAADPTPEVRALTVCSGIVKNKTGETVPFSRLSFKLWQRKQLFKFNYPVVYNYKTVPKNPDQGSYSRVFDRQGMNRTFGNHLRLEFNRRFS